MRRLFSRDRLLYLLERYGLVALLLAVCIFFSLYPGTPGFSSSRNIKAVLSNQALTVIVALGMMFPMVTGEFDLSLGSVMALASLICAGLMSHIGLPVGVAILGSIGIGLGIGAANGLIVTRLKVNSIVTTLGTLTITSALEIWYTSGNAITNGISGDILVLGSGEVVGIPYPVIVMIGIALVSWYFLEETPLGMRMYGVGSNRRAAEIVGLPVRRLSMIGFIAGGLVVGLGGVLLVGVQGSGDPGVGQSYLFPALAAALLGATTIRPGRYNVLGTLVAVYFLAFTVSGMTLAGAQAWVKNVFDGAALIVAVGVSVWSGMRRRQGGGRGAGGETEPEEGEADLAAQEGVGGEELAAALVERRRWSLKAGRLTRQT